MPLSPPDEKYQSGEPRTPEAIEPGIIISPDTRRANRIPPGQSRTRKWPVLHYAHVPTVPLERWRLTVFGLVERPLSFSWDEFQALPRVKVYADFHCVTRWSRLDNVWEGVSVREIIERVGVKPEAKFVVPHGYDSGWTTNLPLFRPKTPSWPTSTTAHRSPPTTAAPAGWWCRSCTPGRAPSG
jgi:DMSO/TMAO reductase YedYZ molybdopterin-dependent catalytic subunit